jgi:phage shock protein A
MSLFRRMSDVFQQKANATLDKAENPAQALDLSYQKLLENLQQVRRSIADVLTAEKRLEGQRDTLKMQYEKLQGQARLALQQGQEDLARTALSRGQVVQTQIDSLGPQIDNLKQQESQLEVAGQKLTAKVEAFRAQKDTMKAQYTAAKASTQAMEGITGLSEHMADVTMMIERAQDKVETMQARASAVGQLADSGVIDSLQIGRGLGDDIDRQLQAASSGANVEAQMAAMRGELGVGAPQSGASGEIGTGAEPVAPTDSIVVRVAGDEQYEVPHDVSPALDRLDLALVRSVYTGDTAGFAQAKDELLKLIKSSGKLLPATEVRTSDVIVPSADMTIDDARSLLDDGAGTVEGGGPAAPSQAAP